MIPYGYQIVQGQAAINAGEAERLLRFTSFYLEGASVANAARMAGVNRAVSNCCAMLRNPVYLGDEFYPPLFSQDLARRLKAEHSRRRGTRKPGGRKRNKPATVQTEFLFQPEKSPKNLSPLELAQWVYEQIQPKEDFKSCRSKS